MGRRKSVKNKNVFIVDIDGTLCDFDESFIGIAHALSIIGVEEMKSLDSRLFLKLSYNGIMTEEDELKVIKLMEILNVFENLKIFPNVPELLAKISSEGDSLVYLSSRPNRIIGQTVSWLEKNGLPRPQDGYYEDMQHRVLMMHNNYCNKEENLNKIVNFYKDDNKIFYIENSPKYVEKALLLDGVNKIFTFANSYIFEKSYLDIFTSSKVEIVKKPEDGGFQQIIKKVF